MRPDHAVQLPEYTCGRIAPEALASRPNLTFYVRRMGAEYFKTVGSSLERTRLHLIHHKLIKAPCGLTTSFAHVWHVNMPLFPAPMLGAHFRAVFCVQHVARIYRIFRHCLNVVGGKILHVVPDGYTQNRVLPMQNPLALDLSAKFTQ